MMSLIFPALLTAVTLALILKASPSNACMTVLVGRNASATGEVLVGHNEDAPGRCSMQTHLVHKLRRHQGTKAKFEPSFAELELPETRTSLFWAEAKYYDPENPGPSFCDSFVNGHGVVIVSNNCAESREDNPELTDGGIGYGLRRITAETAHTAKEAVEIASRLIDKYGYASSGRSYAFADKEEIFVMQAVRGKHYAVHRVPDDEVAVIPNHYTIHEPDKKAHGYAELVDYAVKRGWYKPEDGTFDFKRVYQAEDSYADEKNTHRHVRAFQMLLDIDLSPLLMQEWEPLPFSIKPAHPVSIEMIKKILRTHFEDSSSYTAGNDSPHFSKPLTVCNAETLESSIFQIRHNPDRIVIRKSLGSPCCSPYIAWYFGIPSIPEGYEDKDADTSTAEHFATSPADMDYRNNAWYRAMEIKAACDILYDEKADYIHEKVREFEEEEEKKFAPLDSQLELRIRNSPDIARAMMEGFVISQAEELSKFRESMRHELGILTGEALTSAVKGKKFSVMIPSSQISADSLDVKECKCGPSYLDFGKWSECSSVGTDKGSLILEFTGGEWRNDSVPCFMDLYMIIREKSGRKYAGVVRMRVRD
ncbi:MAG: C69 family dipeptidase [Synergistaceae bacterium]|nr:C69 family dipeptidase [Synergistaceae bacterium]